MMISKLSRLWICVILFGTFALAATTVFAQSQNEERLQVWLPEGAHVEQRLTLLHNVVTRITAPEPPADVLDFYTERFEQEGWTLVSTFEADGAYTVFAIKGRQDATLTIQPDGGGSRIRVSVSRTEWQRIEPDAAPRR